VLPTATKMWPQCQAASIGQAHMQCRWMRVEASGIMQ
jgi:hypothetical protein